MSDLSLNPVYCIKCKKQLPPESAFCAYCGTSQTPGGKEAPAPVPSVPPAQAAAPTAPADPEPTAQPAVPLPQATQAEPTAPSVLPPLLTKRFTLHPTLKNPWFWLVAITVALVLWANQWDYTDDGRFRIHRLTGVRSIVP